MTLSARVEYLFNLKSAAQGYNIGRILVWRDNILFSVLNVHIFEKRPNDPALTFSFVGRTKILYRFFQCSDSILNELIIFHDASLCLTPAISGALIRASGGGPSARNNLHGLVKQLYAPIHGAGHSLLKLNPILSHRNRPLRSRLHQLGLRSWRSRAC